MPVNDFSFFQWLGNNCGGIVPKKCFPSCPNFVHRPFLHLLCLRNCFVYQAMMQPSVHML